MNLDGHNIYFDITQHCNIGCDFCMYANNHAKEKHFEISETAILNIETLINDDRVKRISISGEGEPLNNLSALRGIMAASRGGNNFEFITSGSIPEGKLAGLYDELENNCVSRGDICNIRLSTDRFHVSKVRHAPHAASFKYFLAERRSGITLSFRSVDIDRSFTRDFLLAELSALDVQASLSNDGPLRDVLTAGELKFSIEYKNLVKPDLPEGTAFMTLEEYVAALSERYGKPFTIGALNRSPMPNGIGITVKPDGNVMLYGIDSHKVADIHHDRLGIEFFEKRIIGSRLVRNLYSVPFMDLIDLLSENDDVKKLIARINNPYWIIGEISRLKPSALEAIS